jgi:ubiquitin carboxyl-terminal hydrolase 10
METPSNLPHSTQPEQPEQSSVPEEPTQPEPEQQTLSEQPVLPEIEHATSTQTPSEVDSTHPTTPASVVSAIMPKSASTQAPPPVVPPVLPRKITAATPVVKETKQQPSKNKAVEETKVEETKVESAEPATEKKEDVPVEASAPASESPTPAPAVLKPASPAPTPKSWADMLKSNAAANAKPLVPKVNGHTITANSSIGDVLAAFDIHNDGAAPHLQPRGLINTGNMCFMNAVSCIFSLVFTALC